MTESLVDGLSTSSSSTNNMQTGQLIDIDDLAASSSGSSSHRSASAEKFLRVACLVLSHFTPSVASVVALITLKFTSIVVCLLADEVDEQEYISIQ